MELTRLKKYVKFAAYFEGVVSLIERGYIVAHRSGRSFVPLKIFAACLSIGAMMFAQSIDKAPIQIGLQQARLLPGGHDLGYFLQKEIAVAARKGGWWNTCYGEVKFANGDEAHVLPETQKDYVLGGGLPLWLGLKFLITFHPKNASESMSIRLVCDDGISEWLLVERPTQVVADQN